jgi:hypothetical protein
MYHSRIKTGGSLIRDLGAAAVLLEAALGETWDESKGQW